MKNVLIKYSKPMIAAVLALAILLAGAAGYKVTRPKPPKTILVNGNYVVVDDSLALNTLPQEMFIQDADGRWLCHGVPTVTGIDVSSHQGEIDWKAVAADGIGAAIIRVGFRGYQHGDINADASFRTNLAGARASGLPVGVYFFSQAVSEEEALEEAVFVLDALGGEPLELPIVFDWEPMDRAFTDGDAAQVRTVGKEDAVTASALAFCDAVEAAGYQSMIYLNNDTGYFVYDIGQLQGRKLWYAAYHSTWSDYYYAHEGWQYTDHGTVAGIEGPVDLTLWFTDPYATNGNAETDGNAEN